MKENEDETFQEEKQERSQTERPNLTHKGFITEKNTCYIFIFIKS